MRHPRDCSRSSGPSGCATLPYRSSGFVGVGIGAALGGLRPIVEVMTVNFSLLALDQIVNTAAALRHMSGGQFSVPLVVRMATGAGRQLAAQHSHSLEGWYAHIPGIKVVAPATVEDAYGMLGTALADPDPVVIFEHVQLYNTATDVDDLTANGHFSRRDPSLRVRCHGHHVRRLPAEDARCSERAVAGRNRLRGHRSAGAAAAGYRHDHRIGPQDPPRRYRRRGLAHRQSGGRDQRAHRREAFFDLDAPIARVCSAEVPMPYAKHLEQAALPQPDKIVAAVKSLFGEPS